MHYLRLLLVLEVLGFSRTGHGSPSNGPLNRRSCATQNWPGWEGIKHAFIFGDSYTATQFSNTLTQPSIGNPLGNPTYPGFTSANGPNWVDFLTVQYNASLVLTYNLAYGGATVDSSLVAPYLPTVLTVVQQVEDEYLPTYAGSPAIAPWGPKDTLFAVFIGINDVGNSYSEGVPTTSTLNSKIFQVYSDLVQKLYDSGARNFLFLNVPPVERSPLTKAQGAAAVTEEAADLAAFNTGISNLTATLKATHADTNVFSFDTHALFNTVLDDPSSFPQTSIYKNTTDYCIAYENGTAANDTFDLSCGIPVNEYFWLNTLHPTYPMHNVLAQEVSMLLGQGPNVC